MTTGQMMKRFATRMAFATLMVCAVPCQLLAQRDYSRLNVQRAAELSLFGGGTQSGPAFGWSVGWRAWPRVALQGGGIWVDESGVDGFAALFGARVYLNTRERVTPFVTAEAGLFNASVDSTNPDIPDLYGDRIATGFTETFNDFVGAGGVGLDIHVGGRIWLRPDARLLVVVDGWRANVLMLAGVHFTYRFTVPGG